MYNRVMKSGPVWIYNSSEFNAELMEDDRGILIFYPVGRIDLTAIESFFAFLRDYKRTSSGMLILLVENSLISSIEMKARIFVVDSIMRSPFIDIAVSFGENLLFSTIVNIFTSIMSRLQLRHSVFKSEKEALDWASNYL